ncbi:MAG: DUF433 domain-containing protein [Thermomicrobiales bacterium]
MSDPREEPIYRNRITVDPDILVGKPVITGTRIPVSLILNLLAHEYTFDRVIQAYPILTAEDIRAAIAYAGARLDRDELRSLSG